MIGQLLTGRYLILEKLGAGGFSETYLARDKYLPRHPLCVVKCLKLPLHSTISLETAHRLFETEAHLLEQFGRHHHQIPTLFAYSQEQDSTYLVQEYIEGENFSTWLSQGKRFTQKAAIALLLEMLPILNYIHSHRVIHRDITPSNLICRRRDSKVVLIDFGAAYCLPETESSMQPDTELPLEIGTPGYMPDEQRLGMAQTNSDLYGLGILVIHLLTGVDPRQFKQDLISGELDWQRYLQPSSVSSELLAILNRMVRSRVGDRYQQASEVLTDLQALPAAQRFRQKGTSQRSWVQQMVLPASTMLLIGAIASQAFKGTMGGWFSDYGQQAKSALTQLEQRFLPQSDGHLTMLREMSIKSGVERVLIAPNNQVMVTAGADHVLRLWSLPSGRRIKTLVGYKAPVTTLAISQNSKLLVSGREDGTLQLWDAASGKFLKTFKGHQKSVTAIAISPDLQTLVSSSSKDRTLRQWNLKTGALLQTLNLPQADVTAITYGATSNTLITASRGFCKAAPCANRQLQVWDLRTGKIHRTFSGHTDTIVGLQLVNDHTLISFGKDRGLMWDLNREALVQVLPEASANPILISRCNRNIMTVHSNGSIRTWIPQSGNLVMRETGTLEHPANVAFSPDHDYLVTWNANKRVSFWQINHEAIH
ncbi:serine/threonine-protein kinase [Phormidesmis priestleyi]|nr:serine/threonine-protein kinase [Phormidesmis priestleyi]